MPVQIPGEIYRSEAKRNCTAIQGSGRAYAELKKQHMPVQTPSEIYRSKAERNCTAIQGSGRAYAELKIGENLCRKKLPEGF